MITTRKNIHKAIEAAKPDTFDGLLKVLSQFRLRNGISWTNVYCFGAYQGVRVIFFDSKAKKHILPAPDSVYCIKEYSELPRTNVDLTGFEIK